MTVRPGTMKVENAVIERLNSPRLVYLPELGQRDRKIGFWVKKGSQRSEVYAEEITQGFSEVSSS